MKLSYFKSYTKAEDLPDDETLELCFVGRSNVGKSSLINNIAKQKNLARSSKTPGRTQMLNYFNVEGSSPPIAFVDLPGYGFHKASKELSKHWHELINRYLTRPNIRAAIFIFDIRRDFNEEDDICFQLLAKIPHIIFVATKTDKLNKAQLINRTKTVKESLSKKLRNEPVFFLVSNTAGYEVFDPLRDYLQSRELI